MDVSGSALFGIWEAVCAKSERGDVVTVLEPQQRMGLRHLSRLTDDRGILEHAKYEHPRFEHGYCTDDNARLLIVATRDGGNNPDSSLLARIAARFVIDALRPNGQILNRMSFDRMWIDSPSTDDCWGRALWALGTAVTHSSDAELRSACYQTFGVGASTRSDSFRAMCFALLGAAEMVRINPSHTGAQALLKDGVAMFAFHPNGHGDWQWPEQRLSYANALIPEAMMAVGEALHYSPLIHRGSNLLYWLVQQETFGHHLSVTPVGGRGQGDPKPGFDQQPIEVAAIADAAARASAITGDDYWEEVIDMAVNWFLGNNDAGLSMIDAETGGGYDGLHSSSVNVNQGAESTLAMISTMQYRSSAWLV